MSPEHILFLFLDGVGLGPPHPPANPFAQLHLPAFAAVAGGQAWTSDARPLARDLHVVRAIDATLGVDGLPQSGTGQAALFTGVNCAALAGRHFGPYPHSATRAAIASDNVFVQLRACLPASPEPAAFLNAYPPRFFTYAQQRDRWTVTTRCCLEAGLRIRDVDAVRAGDALTAEITGRAWRDQLGLDVPLLTEEQAGRQFVRVAERHRFTLFEYFLTDKAGHSQSFERAREALLSLDRFLSAVVEALDPERHLLVITSDHGNLEDLSTRSHTRHPVPLIALGRGASHFAGITDLTGVVPAIRHALCVPEGAGTRPA